MKPTDAPPLAVLDRAIQLACESVSGLPAPHWTQLEEPDLWREAVSCMLGSGVRLEQAEWALAALDSIGVLSPWAHPPDRLRLEGLVVNALSASANHGGYRFPRTRAAQLAAAVELLYWSDRSLGGLIRHTEDAREARRILVGEIPGIGPKQASLFLRNIGFSSDVAILDCHVLRYMSWQGGPEMIEPVRNLTRYEQLEDLLRTDADRLGIELGELDRAIWLVMRTWRGSMH